MAIGNVLRQGERTFSELLEATGLSRSALAFHLKKMHTEGEVSRRMYPKDFRVTFYSLTDKGRSKLHKHEDIVFLGSAKFNVKEDGFTALSSEDFSEVAKGIAEALQHVFKKGLIACIWGPSESLLKECVSFSIYSKNKLNIKALKTAKRLAEIAKSAMLAGIGSSSSSELNNTPSFTIVFRVNKDKMNEYLKTWVARKETLKFPNVEDYLKKSEP
jgi:DNA-binding MarR family transcriptional regulator